MGRFKKYSEGNEKMNNLKKLREKAGLTQRELAEKSGISIHTIISYEQGKRELSGASYSSILKLAKVLQVKPEELFNSYDDVTHLIFW